MARPTRRSARRQPPRCPGWVPFESFNLNEDVPGSLAAPAKALSYPWKHYIGGHMADATWSITWNPFTVCRNAKNWGTIFMSEEPGATWIFSPSAGKYVLAQADYSGNYSKTLRARLGSVGPSREVAWLPL
jgi:hypothetical protein